jgi:hypothetical protein
VSPGVQASLGNTARPYLKKKVKIVNFVTYILPRLKKKKPWAGGVAQVVECLPSKNDTQCSKKKKISPGAGGSHLQKDQEAEIRRILFQRSHGQIVHETLSQKYRKNSS